MDWTVARQSALGEQQLQDEAVELLSAIVFLEEQIDASLRTIKRECAATADYLRLVWFSSLLSRCNDYDISVCGQLCNNQRSIQVHSDACSRYPVSCALRRLNHTSSIALRRFLKSG